MKNNKLETMKKEYDNISIPEDLLGNVEESIKKAKRAEKNENLRFMYKSIGGGIVAAAVLTVVLINTNVKVARALETVPGLSKIVKVIDFRSYRSKDNEMEANINVPEVVIEDDNGIVNEESTAKINLTINEYTNKIIAMYEHDVKASDSEGKMLVDLDYKVITNTDRLFSIRFNELVVMASGAESVKIYHIDKLTGNEINITDLFDANSDFINVISDNIKEQMKLRMGDDENLTYWVESEVPEWDFKSITDESTFYINENGQLVIVFDEYEVAPGFMGAQEFIIDNDLIRSLEVVEYFK